MKVHWNHVFRANWYRLLSDTSQGLDRYPEIDFFLTARGTQKSFLQTLSLSGIYKIKSSLASVLENYTLGRFFFLTKICKHFDCILNNLYVLFIWYLFQCNHPSQCFCFTSVNIHWWRDYEDILWDFSPVVWYLWFSGKLDVTNWKEGNRFILE